MYSNPRRNFYFLFLLSVCLLFSFFSCSEDQEFELQDFPNVINFTVSADKMTSGSFKTKNHRFDLSGNQEEDDAFIDPADLFIGIYSIDGELTRVAYNTSGIETPGFSSENNFNNYNFTLFLDRETFNEGLIICVLANFSPYLDEGTSPDVTSVKTISESVYSFSVDRFSKGYIPMSGLIKLESADLYNLSNSYPQSLRIGLTRRLAKIEICDLLPEGQRIVSASLSEYVEGGFVGGSDFSINNDYTSPFSTGNDIEFYFDEENKKYYVYVPEKELGEKDSDSRRIDVIIDNNGKETSGKIWLSKVTDDESSEDWSRLEGNHCYRFNVTGFNPGDEEPQPEYEVTDTIRLVWVNTGTSGKFSSANPYVNLVNEDNPDIPLLRIGGTGYSRDWTFDPSDNSIYLVYFCDIDYASLGVPFEKLRYQLLTNPSADMTSYLTSSVAGESVKIELRTDDDGSGKQLTYCWLNMPVLNNRAFAQDAMMKIYWKTPSGISYIDLNNINALPSQPGGTWQTDERGYSFIEIRISDYIYNNQIGYDIKPVTGTNLRGTITKTFFSYQTLGDDRAFEFYVN